MEEMTKEKYLDLIDEIKRHDKLYFELHDPEISDYDYDQLVKKVEDYEKEHPEWIAAVSPTQAVGEKPTKGFKQVDHTVPMLSLANSYSETDVEDFIKRVHKLLESQDIKFSAELKMDGIAVSLRYENGVFSRGLTRGNGKRGDDITRNLKTLKDLPMKLKGSFPKHLEVRAEVFMPKKVFTKLNKKKEEAGEDVWANPRNAAAGSLKLLDAEETRKRELTLIVYGIVEGEKGLIETQEEAKDCLEKWGFPTFSNQQFSVCDSASKLLEFSHQIEKKRDSLPFEIDGMVFKTNELKYWDRLGAAGKKPRYAIAYKFAPLQAVTIIEDITIQVGRTGVLTPVAELKPVFLAGSTISRATLHNEYEIDRKDIRINDSVIIEKGGDVIPKVVEVLFEKRGKSSKKWAMPKQCPICLSDVQRKEGEVAVRCKNSSCQAQNLRRLIFFASKEAMNIETLGNKVMTKFVEEGLIGRFSDIYKITKEDIEQFEGFKEKSIQNLLSHIKGSKNVTLSRLIFALGIPYIGTQTADILAETRPDIESIMSLTKEELLNLEGIGEKVADSFIVYFQNPEHIKEIQELKKLGINPKQSKDAKSSNHEFLQKSFVLTGSLENYTRSEAKELIKQRGGKVSSTVSKKTDFLLVGEDPGSKHDKAKDLGITILTEDEFEKRL